MWLFLQKFLHLNNFIDVFSILPNLFIHALIFFIQFMMFLLLGLEPVYSSSVGGGGIEGGIIENGSTSLNGITGITKCFV